MKIVYDNKILKTSVIDKLKRACNKKYKIGKTESWLFSKKGNFFLEISTGRVNKKYKIDVSDGCIHLKYCGTFSFMNILISIFMVGIPTMLSIFLLILMLLTKSFEEITAILLVLPVSFAYLWLFIIRHRILAKKFIDKLLNLQNKK